MEKLPLLRDVWVNWFEGEEFGYNVYEFHEWRKTDEIELMDQMPVLKVSAEMFDYLENGLEKLPSDLLALVKDKSTIRRNNKRKTVEYAFVAVHKNQTIVIDTSGYDIPIKKSRMINRQNDLALEIVEDVEELTFTLDEKLHKQYCLLCPNPKLMYGLTRRERQLKQLLFMALDDLQSEKNVHKLRYIYSEWNYSEYASVKEMDFEILINKLINEVEAGWGFNHEQLCKILIKNQSFLETVYENENIIKTA
jgi:hypothetical protein